MPVSVTGALRERAPTSAAPLPGRAGHGIPRDKVFSEKFSARVHVRPQFEAALARPADQGPGPRAAASSSPFTRRSGWAAAPPIVPAAVQPSSYSGLPYPEMTTVARQACRASARSPARRPSHGGSSARWRWSASAVSSAASRPSRFVAWTVNSTRQCGAWPLICRAGEGGLEPRTDPMRVLIFSEEILSRGMPCALSVSSCGCSSWVRWLHRAYPMRSPRPGRRSRVRPAAGCRAARAGQRCYRRCAAGPSCPAASHRPLPEQGSATVRVRTGSENGSGGPAVPGDRC